MGLAAISAEAASNMNVASKGKSHSVIGNAKLTLSQLQLLTSPSLLQSTRYQELLSQLWPPQPDIRSCFSSYGLLG